MWDKLSPLSYLYSQKIQGARIIMVENTKRTTLPVRAGEKPSECL